MTKLTPTMPGSPMTPPVPPRPVMMDFYDAVRAIMDMKIVRRLEWNNNDYCLLEGTFLKIFTKGKLQNWLINDGDIEGTDWVIVKQPN